MNWGIRIRLSEPYGAVVQRVADALKEQGFGVLTEIDVQATLRQKLGEEIEDYIILGACNPALAHRALQADRQAGLLLPCNVVVRADGAGTIARRLTRRSWPRSREALSSGPLRRRPPGA